MLEDESGRLRLIGTPLTGEMLVTGCIVAVMGTENANGDFEVVDIKVPDLPPQPERWHAADLPPTDGSRKKIKLDSEDEEMDKPVAGSGKKVAIVSGLSFSGTSSEHSLEINLLTEYLLGEALDPATHEAVSQISRLVIAGNSIALDTEAVSHDTMGNAKKAANKKYGYDSSAYNPAPTTHFDNFLASLLPSIPITLIPGFTDPANVSLPQQAIHSAMFPQARAYGAMPPGTGEEGQVAWFDTVTNPWEGEIEGWKVLGTGGQNVDDVFKYVESEDRLGMMEAMCRWRCCAPTAPDTLCECGIPPLLRCNTTNANRELPVPGQRPVRAELLSASILRRIATEVRYGLHRGTAWPNGSIDSSSSIYGHWRDCPGGFGDFRGFGC